MAGVPFWGLNDGGTSCAEGPTFMSDPWDTFFINNFQVPGTCTIQGNPGGYSFRTIKGAGSDGSTIIVDGYRPGEFDLLIEITTEDQWNVYQTLLDAFSPAQKQPASLPGVVSILGALVPVDTKGLVVAVGHPELQTIGVNKAVLVDVPLSHRGGAEGARVFEWKFVHQRNVKPVRTRRAVAALPPEDNRLPPSNGAPELPSSNPANMTLQGPPLTTQGGAK